MEDILKKVGQEGIAAVEESEVAYYIWPKPVNGYISYLYRKDKKTGKVLELFVMDAIDEYPDFGERIREVDPSEVFV